MTRLLEITGVEREMAKSTLLLLFYSLPFSSADSLHLDRKGNLYFPKKEKMRCMRCVCIVVHRERNVAMKSIVRKKRRANK